MSKIIFLLFLIPNVMNAFECTMTINDGTIYTTMSSTYSEDDNVKSMWFESKKIVKKKVIATSKDKLEVKDKKFRVAQYVEYDAKGNTKYHQKGNSWDDFEEPIPNSIGEWKTYLVNVGAYLDIDFDKQTAKNSCDLFNAGWFPTDENGTVIPPPRLQR